MSKRGNKMERIVKDAEFTTVTEPSTEQTGHQGETVNLDDVGFMVMVGRYKDGTPFVVNVNVNDIMTVRGLLEWGIDELKAAGDDYRKNKKVGANE